MPPPLLRRPTASASIIASATVSDAVFGHLPPPLRRRLLQNPAYYDLEDASPEGLSEFMSSLVEDALQALADSGCVLVSSFCSILHIC